MRPTLLLEGAELTAGGTVRVEGDTYRHYFRARRLARGERVRVADGDGAAAYAAIEEVTRSDATLRLEEPAPSGEPSLRLSVAAAVIRPERAATLVEKLTEIGVAEILWFRAERSQHRLSERTLERLRRISRAAVEQCGRSRVPAQEGEVTFDDLVRQTPAQVTVLLDPATALGTPPVHQVLQLLGGDVRPAPRLLLGPEGGFSAHERERLREAGAHPVSLGPRTLRAETAAIAGAALLLATASD